MEEFLRNTTNKETSNKEILPPYIFHLDVNDGVSVKNAIKILTESRRIDMLVNKHSASTLLGAIDVLMDATETHNIKQF